MNKLFLITLLTLISSVVYASTKQSCDVYRKSHLVGKATIRYYSDVDHYRIMVQDKLFYFNSSNLKKLQKLQAKEDIPYKDTDVVYTNNDKTRKYYIQENRVTSLGSDRSRDYTFKNCKEIK